MNEKIDFVIIWVDGNDKEWQKEKERYSPDKNTDSRNIRYRDWENLKYWFRGVEKFAPWVNKVYFVTCGHYPEWINKEHPKLVCVKHSEFIPKEYLPTFNSNVIDLHLHRIKGLSENFVYFNDDTFIINHVKEKDFFKNGMPCDEYAETPVIPYKSIFPYSLFNNTFIVNNHFRKKEVYRKNFFKLYSIKNGINVFRTLLANPYKNFIGFYSPHIPMSFSKKYFEKIWNLEQNSCVNTSKNRFRSKQDITIYLVRYFQNLEGWFSPRKSNLEIRVLNLKNFIT